ncbi:MAG: hypothetical protein CMM45_10090 [Rhodospirillaceae bacterium]|nr:hypothetical protein [Rhodospirillaceae bacterium]
MTYIHFTVFDDPAKINLDGLRNRQQRPRPLGSEKRAGALSIKPGETLAVTSVKNKRTRISDEPFPNKKGGKFTSLPLA